MNKNSSWKIHFNLNERCKKISSLVDATLPRKIASFLIGVNFPEKETQTNSKRFLCYSIIVESNYFNYYRIILSFAYIKLKQRSVFFPSDRKENLTLFEQSFHAGKLWYFLNEIISSLPPPSSPYSVIPNNLKVALWRFATLISLKR